MGKITIGTMVRLGPYGRVYDHDEKSEIRSELVGRIAVVVEVLMEKDNHGCRQAIVKTVEDGYEIEWRICSLIFV
jgi:hypothetical protein